MSDDLPFIHRAEDPTPDRSARAFDRVRQAVHRRRARRRTLVALPAAIVLLAVVAAVAWPSDDPDQLVTTGSTTTVAPELQVDANTKWHSGTLAADGRTITVLVGSSPEGDGPCEQRFEYDVVETAESVTIAFEEQPSTVSTTGPTACKMMLVQQPFEIELEQPLGDREVFDGIQAAPRPIARMSELVEVTWVPTGFTGDGGTPLEPDEADSHRWQQTFQNDGADWYFAVNQAPEGRTTTPEGTPSPVTVHGVEGTRYAGQMNNTMESITWTEGGLDLTVWGEMQGPPTFTHHDELLQIAEGIRLPQAEGDDAPDGPTATSSTTRPAPTTTAPATTTVTITDHSQTCAVVKRPTSGDGGVPAQGGSPRLEQAITWGTSLVLTPPGADEEPRVSADSLPDHHDGPHAYGPNPVTKLAVLADPLNPSNEQHRLVWVTFFPQSMGFADMGGPIREPKAPTTTESPHRPCAKVAVITDAMTGEDVKITSTG